jgi:hypothetical protein
MSGDDADDYGGGSMYNQSITRSEHDALVAEYPNASIERCREIISKLLKLVPVYGHAKYDPQFGDDRECECGHAYHRHFDSYENMAPAGCKYCYRCYAFVEKGDRDRWNQLNPDC